MRQGPLTIMLLYASHMVISISQTQMASSVAVGEDPDVCPTSHLDYLSRNEKGREPAAYLACKFSLVKDCHRVNHKPCRTVVRTADDGAGQADVKGHAGVAYNSFRQIRTQEAAPAADQQAVPV